MRTGYDRTEDFEASKRKGCVRSFLIAIGLGILWCITLAWIGLHQWDRAHDVLLIRSDHEVTVIGRYMGWACGGFTPDIRPIDATLDMIPIREQFSGFAFHVPPGLLAPDQIDELGVPGNEFLVRGFYYYAIIDGKNVLQNRFDLTAWRPISPYHRWKGKSGDAHKEIVENGAQYQRYWNYVKPENAVFTVAQTYDYDCL